VYRGPLKVPKAYSKLSNNFTNSLKIKKYMNFDTKLVEYGGRRCKKVFEKFN
jgi:hypothetical protein